MQSLSKAVVLDMLESLDEHCALRHRLVKG